MKSIYRTHWIEECTKEVIDQHVILNGWVQKRRNLGGLIFFDLRDRSGIVQVVLNPTYAAEATQIAEEIRSEYVISVRGKVVARSKETINPNMVTGEIEIEGDSIHIFNPSKTPPFMIQDTDTDEVLRLKHRYLDLRRPEMQKNFILRHQAMQSVRRFLDREKFIEVETPILTKSTPEGARDYLVPSRVQKGNFFALPQSPQLFKQLLMVSGFERYFQFPRCFRDEDLRADRQPEFTQIDIEVSFLELESFLSLMEEMIVTLFRDTIGVEVETPFKRLSYAEAMDRYGSDKPDLRYGMELISLSEELHNSTFKVFADTLANKGVIKAINVKGCARFSRKDVDYWAQEAIRLGAKGLAWVALKEEGIKGSCAKFLSEEELEAIIQKTGMEKGDLLFIVADKRSVVTDVLGSLRVLLAKNLNLINEAVFNFLWVTEFPLLEYAEDEGRFYAMHHPFTMPLEDDIPLLQTDPDQVRAIAYDMVLNGFEIGGGSRRINQRDIQELIFNTLGLSEEEAQSKFDFLLEAFQYGTPPHQGIAFGFDRIVMLLSGSSNIRECIAFPKTSNAGCLLTNAPSAVDKRQLEDLGIQIQSDLKN